CASGDPAAPNTTLDFTGVCAPAAYTLGTTVVGGFAIEDCDAVGHDEGRIDNYIFTLSAPTAVRFTTMAAGAVRTDYEVDAWPNPLEQGNFVVSRSAGSLAFAMLPAGTYMVMMQSFSRSGGGTYTLKVDAVPSLDGCTNSLGVGVVLRPGVSVTQR